MKMILITLLFSFNLYADSIGIDVRSYWETKMNAAPGAIHIPMNKLNKEKLKELSKDVEYKVFCEAGGRAEKAVKFLKTNGYKAINFNSWREWNQLEKKGLK